MNSERTTMTKADPKKGVGQQARRRVAYRLLPFVFLLYVVNYIDRVKRFVCQPQDECRSGIQ